MFLFSFVTIIIILLQPLDTVIISNQDKIIGPGNFSKLGQFPYQVAIFSNGFTCAGSIITPKKILTAAHCCFNKITKKNLLPDDFFIVAGILHLDYSKEAQVRHVVKIIVHFAYNPKIYDYDIALMILEKNLIFNEFVHSISINTKSLHAGDICLVSGWGHKKGIKKIDPLNYVTVTVDNFKKCKAFYRPEMTITKNMICAGI